MHNISQLIVDMTNQGATKEELARVIDHSIVLMDSEKKYNIEELRKKYFKGREW